MYEQKTSQLLKIMGPRGLEPRTTGSLFQITLIPHKGVVRPNVLHIWSPALYLAELRAHYRSCTKIDLETKKINLTEIKERSFGRIVGKARLRKSALAIYLHGSRAWKLIIYHKDKPNPVLRLFS